MKEISIEEKAQRYDKALKIAKKWYDSNTNEGFRGIFEDIFSELKESENERIRKDLIQWINEFPDTIWRGHYKKDVIAWLEKQGDKLGFKAQKGEEV